MVTKRPVSEQTRKQGKSVLGEGRVDERALVVILAIFLVCLISFHACFRVSLPWEAELYSPIQIHASGVFQTHPANRLN